MILFKATIDYKLLFSSKDCGKVTSLILPWDADVYANWIPLIMRLPPTGNA